MEWVSGAPTFTLSVFLVLNYHFASELLADLLPESQHPTRQDSQASTQTVMQLSVMLSVMSCPHSLWQCFFHLVMQTEYVFLAFM